MAPFRILPVIRHSLALAYRLLRPARGSRVDGERARDSRDSTGRGGCGRKRHPSLRHVFGGGRGGAGVLAADVPYSGAVAGLFEIPQAGAVVSARVEGARPSEHPLHGSVRGFPLDSLACK